MGRNKRMGQIFWGGEKEEATLQDGGWTEG